MLGLHEPVWPGTPAEPVPGPEEVPPTPEQEVVAFDRIELESKAYRERAGSIAFDQFQGGTGAPVFELEAQQKLLRMLMQEVAFVYGELLSNHQYLVRRWKSGTRKRTQRLKPFCGAMNGGTTESQAFQSIKRGREKPGLTPRPGLLMSNATFLRARNAC